MHCYFCGSKLIWNCDYSFEDFMLDGEGIVTVLTCSNDCCQATFEGYLPFDEECC